MRKKIIFLLLAVAMILPGCTKLEGATVEEKDYSMHYTSNISEEECCICGTNNRSMMDYYRKSGMIGLVCLNTMNISSLDNRPYLDGGTEVIDSGNFSISTTAHGEGECRFQISGMPGRGIFEAEVYYGDNSMPDFGMITEFLCQKCLDKVAEMYEDEMNWSEGEGRFPEVCLVDFATNELYTLGEHHTGYWIRDFWVHLDHGEDKSDIMVIYAPEDKMEGYNYVSEDLEEMQN